MPHENAKIPHKNNKTNEYFLFLKFFNKKIDFTSILYKKFNIIFWKNVSIRALQNSHVKQGKKLDFLNFYMKKDLLMMNKMRI